MDDQSDMRKMSPRGRFFMSLPFFFVGCFTFALVFGWIPAAPNTIHAPLWVLAAVATVFLLAGVLILLVENERLARLRNLVTWLFVVCLAIPFNWIAFGEGERHFSGSNSFLGFMSSSTPGETEGRIVFGFFAVLMDLLVLLVPVRALFRKRRED